VSGLTCAEPRSTRLAVARETPARAATTSSVARSRTTLTPLDTTLRRPGRRADAG
jgi:hypothetical protein